MFEFLRKNSIADTADSATSYEDVDTPLGSGDYEPVAPFKGVIVTIASGNIVIEGLDGVQVTLPVGVRVDPYPFGGAKIIQTGTTATGIIAVR